jgi:hypothetical protein
VVMATATSTSSSGSGNNNSARKDAIAAVAINRRCSQGWPPLPLLMKNDYLWLLAVIIINCAAAVMIGGRQL